LQEGYLFIIFFGVSWTVLSSKNNIYQAEPENFLIKVYSPHGASLHTFYYPHTKLLLTKKSASQYGLPDKFISEMKFMNLPKYWPVLVNMKIDDQNRLWVATTVQNMKVYQWWVLNPNGNLIARFTWPRDKYIKAIKNGYVYAMEKNKKGLTHFVRYKLKFKPS